MRIYYKTLLKEVLLDKETSQRIFVNRKTLGDEVILFNEAENATFKIVSLNPQVKLLRISPVLKTEPFPFPRLSIFQGKLEKSKYDDLVKRLSELGVFSYIIYNSDKTKIQKVKINFMRLNKITNAACEQSGRFIPLIIKEHERKELISYLKMFDKVLVADFLPAAKSLKTMLNFKVIRNLAVVIGPEGGFSEKEREEFIKNNFTFISLGKLTLRAETAPLFVASVFSSEYHEKN